MPELKLQIKGCWWQGRQEEDGVREKKEKGIDIF